MLQGGGAEAAQVGSGGDAGEHGAGFIDLRPANYIGVIVQIPWPNTDVLRQLLARGGGESQEGAE